MYTLFVFFYKGFLQGFFLCKGFLHYLKNNVANDTCCYNYLSEVSESVWETDCR